LERRTFLELAALAALRQTLPHSLSALKADTPAAENTAPNAISAYGSGYFGRWVRDPFGLPAYHYTCDQTKDPKAVLPVNTAWRSKTDHIHQIGNDRLVAVVSNYGHVQVRQDEGSPKFLNDYDPDHLRFGGGIGFLSADDFVLSTYYPGAAETFDRIFGSGYLRKQLQGHQHEIDQVIFAPFGDDPVLVSQVTITNRSSQRTRPRWIEYWGCRPYQFSYRALMEASVQGSADAAPQLRRDFSSRFESRFERVHDGAGLLLRQHFPGRSPEEETLWQNVQASLRDNPNGYYGGPVPPLAPGASFEDTTPPATFLVSLDAHADAFTTDAADFFHGGIEHPLGAQSPLNNHLDSASAERAFFLERHLDLKPGQSQTLYFLYGYLPKGFELDALVAKYSAAPASLLPASSAKWKANRLTFRVESEPWVDREIAWSGCCLRSALTYDSFFREHILSQGAGYQYLAGLQGAARDPLQHALPFVFTDPEIVRGILRYTLKEIQPDGSLPYGIVGAGVPMPCRYRPSDSELWVLWLASEYILATRDVRFLEERIETYPQQGSPRREETVLDLLARCYQHITEVIGTGEHGLQRLLNGDWNDSIVVNRLTPAQVAEITQHGESVLNAAMASYVFDYYGRMLTYAGKLEAADHARAKAEAQRKAVHDQWNGRWFRRAWFGKELGWSGEKQLWLEPQPWAILGGCITGDETQTLVKVIDEMSRQPSPIGALLQSPADPTMKDQAGTGTNGGIFAAINGTLIWALAQVDGAMAWDEWKKNTLARHADTYPDMWFGIWSGPDAYDSILARHPGSTAPDFPVLNMHVHAWPIYSATKLLGIAFDQHGLSLRPVIPVDKFEFASPLVGLHKIAPGQYSGWYAPLVAGKWNISLQLPLEELARIRGILVNGIAIELHTSGNVISFTGESKPGQPLHWEIS
jgi:Glycosyl hydrolase 36 superfamily, catalytic domain